MRIDENTIMKIEEDQILEVMEITEEKTEKGIIENEVETTLELKKGDLVQVIFHDMIDKYRRVIFKFKMYEINDYEWK